MYSIIKCHYCCNFLSIYYYLIEKRSLILLFTIHGYILCCCCCCLKERGGTSAAEKSKQAAAAITEQGKEILKNNEMRHQRLTQRLQIITISHFHTSTFLNTSALVCCSCCCCAFWVKDKEIICFECKRWKNWNISINYWCISAVCTITVVVEGKKKREFEELNVCTLWQRRSLRLQKLNVKHSQLN